MVSTIQHYRSLTPGNQPPSLVAGQIGINHADGRFFYRDAAGAVAFRSLRDYAVLIARGDVANAATLDLSIDPATIGIMRGFVLRLNEAVPASSGSFLGIQIGDAASFKTGSTSYASTSMRAQSGFGYYYGTDNCLAFSIAGTVFGELLLNSNDPTPVHYRRASWHLSYISSGDICSYSGSAAYMTDIDITRLRLLFSSGNISKMRYTLLGLP